MLINIDNGGTFTDLWALTSSASFRTKTRTTPHDLSECFFAGLKSLSEEVYGREDLSQLLADTRYIRYSTTQGTNALVQRKGPRIGLIVRSDFDTSSLNTDADSRDIFDALVGSRIVALDNETTKNLERDSLGEASQQAVLRAINQLTSDGANRIVVSLGSRDAERGFQRAARMRFPEHLLGTVPTLAVSDITADTDAVRATWTAVLNAFLHPAMERFLYHSSHRLQEANYRAPLLVFRNDGLAGRVAKTAAIKTYGSGPEGGMGGAVATAKLYGYPHFVTIDVGGTTTDIGVVDNGQPVTHHRGSVESVNVSIPLSELRSIGVGGGSIIKAEGSDIRVGPQSVGAAPGPACFGYGGTEATITDVKYVNGVIDTKRYFGGRMKLDLNRARAAIDNNVGQPLGLSTEDAADRMDEAWVNAVADSLKKYLKPNSVLGGFGGAGPFSICSIAEACGIKTVMVPGMAAVFSATGIAQSDVGHRFETTVVGGSDNNSNHLDALTERARIDMRAEGFDFDHCKQQWTLFRGDNAPQSLDRPALERAISALNPGEHAAAVLIASHAIGHDSLKADTQPGQHPASSSSTRRARLSGQAPADIPVYELNKLQPGMVGQGPSIIEDDYFTLPVLAGWEFRITANRDIELVRS